MYKHCQCRCGESAGIEDEPALVGETFAGSVGADSIGGEAALADTPEGARDRARQEGFVREMWNRPQGLGGVALVLGLCAASGVFAVLCALAKGALGFGFLAVVIGAPVVEEMAKVVLLLMWLEKAPWRFRSAGTLVFACLASALVFSAIENLLYLRVYIPREMVEDGLVHFRLVVCTAVHVGCTAVSACGVLRAWREARDGRRGFSSMAVTPYLVVAMVMHGIYNAAAVLLTLWKYI